MFLLLVVRKRMDDPRNHDLLERGRYYPEIIILFIFGFYVYCLYANISKQGGILILLSDYPGTY